MPLTCDVDAWTIPVRRLASKQITKHPLSQANDRRVQQTSLIVRQLQKQSPRGLSDGPEVKAKLSGQRSRQAQAYLGRDRALNDVFCDRLFGMPSPQTHGRGEHHTTFFAEGLPL